MKDRYLRLSALAMAAAMMLSACGSSSSTNNNQEQTSTSGSESSTSQSEPLTSIALAQRAANELESLAIHNTQTTAVSDVLTNVYDSLLEVNSKGQVKEALAETWGTNDNGKTWTFNIRQGATWVDYEGNVSANVVAQDWVTGLEWVLNYWKNESRNTSMPIDMIEGAAEYYAYTKELGEEEAYKLTAGEGSKFLEMVGIEAPDDYTVVYHCLDELPYFDTVATYSCLYPISQELLDKVGPENYIAAEYSDYWYNGAYYMSTLVLNNEKVMTKNPHYWDTECTRFDTITYRMVESNENAYSLYQTGEIDYVQLTESAIMSIKDNPDHEFYEYMAEDLPNASVLQFNWNYAKTNEDDSWDYNWNNAIANLNFRKAIYYGLDLTEYYSRSNPVNPLKLEGNTYTCPGFVYLSDGTDYTELVKEGLGIGEYNGETMIRLNKEKAAEYKATAMEELKAIGVTFPVEAAYYVKAGDQTALDTAVVLDNCFKQSLGEDFINLDIRTYVSSQEYQSNGRFSFSMSGWNADYGDPQNMLAQYLHGSDNAIFNVYGTRTNYVEETENNKEVMDMFRTFTEMVNKANAITDDLDARYKAYAEAEIYLLDNCLIMPCQRKVGQCLTNINIYSKGYALYGICNNKMKNWETRKDAYTAAELEELSKQ